MEWLILAVAGYFVIKYLAGLALPPSERRAKPTRSRSAKGTRTVASYRIPPDPRGKPVPSRWVPEGQSVEVGGITIPSGLVYFGSTLKAASGDPEPAQIDPRCEVDRTPTVDVAVDQMGYWPSYARITPSARRAYLEWLRTGRSDPNADIGYVFLFFYGLERRVLIDAANDVDAQQELPIILRELRRLQEIYGSNNSFRRYSSQLIDLLDVRGDGSRLYDGPVPETRSGWNLPLRARVALGQLAADGKPIPAVWALAWARLDPNIRVPRAALRAASEFDLLFKSRYADRYGQGMKLAVNRTKLRVGYQPASPGLMGDAVDSHDHSPLPS